MSSSEHSPYFSSRKQIETVYAPIFSRAYRYHIYAHPLEQYTSPHSLFHSQMNIIIRLDDFSFTKKNLFQVFQIALQSMIFRFNLDINLINIKFIVSNSYYVITKHNQEEQYYFFMGHGNHDNPYVINVKSVRGLKNLSKYLDSVLLTNHYDSATQYFQDQFPDSQVVIDCTTHIVFHIQPDDVPNIVRPIYYTKDIIDPFS